MNKTLLKYLIYITWMAWFIIGVLNFNKFFPINITSSSRVILLLIALAMCLIRLWRVKQDLGTALLDDLGRIVVHSALAYGVFIVAVELYWGAK